MNRQSYIYIAGIILFTAGWVFMIFFPFIGDKNKVMIEIQNSEQQLLEYKQTMKILPEILNRKKEIDLEKKELDSKLYTKADVLKLLDKIKYNAEKTNLTLKEITPPLEELLYLNDIITDSTQPHFLNIGVSLDGDYVNLGKFVKSLENEYYFRGINQCIINSDLKDNREISMYVGFKALLGRVKG